MRMSTLKEMKPLTVRVFDPYEVTTRSHREVDARSVGMRPRDVEAIWNAVVTYYKMGLHPAIAICVRRRGEIILDRAIGHARGNAPDDGEGAELELATPDTLYNFFSGAKCVTAMLVHLLHERNQLHVDEPVATFIPEFAKKRKHRITIRDVLTHRSGIPATPTSVIDLEILDDSAHILDLICELEPTMRPGQAPAYHAITGGFILQALIERVSGMSLREFHEQEIREPLGLEYFDYGVPEELLDRVALDAFSGPIPTWPHKNVMQNALGLPMRDIVEVTNDSRYRTGVIPSGNIIATPEEVSRYFELLLCGGVHDDKRIFKQQTIARAVTPETAGDVDRVLMLPIPYSMGFMLGSERFGFYGARCGKAFGHLGFTNVLGWADPERDISVCLMNTGKPLLSAKFVVWFNVMRVISSVIPRDREAS